MQTTLLGLGIAIILALLTALVGPHFVEWGQYRSTFEAQATRLLGVPVRVRGAIDVRLLPSPSVVLRDVEVGAPNQPVRVKAGQAAVEFALGPLMRGQWRATELRFAQPEFELGLDSNGQLDWGGFAPKIDADVLSVERLSIADGRAVLVDRATGTRLALDRLSFRGELKSLSGPIKGDGDFTTQGERVIYRLSTGRLTDDGLRLRVGLDPTGRRLAVETEGIVKFEPSGPSFDGTLTFTHPAGVVLARGRAVAYENWRATLRTKARAKSILFEQVDLQYGPDDRAMKMTGTAELKVGPGARLDAVLSARQFDLDRALGTTDGQRRPPLAQLRGLTEIFAGALQAPIPVRLGIGFDSVTLGGSPVTGLRGDIVAGPDGWTIDSLEMRAPGFANIRASGQVAFAGGDVSFSGPLALEATDPQTLLAWFDGRDPPAGQSAPLRASGTVTFGAGKLAIEQFRAEIDRKTLEGRFDYRWTSGSHPARLEAQLQAAEVDADQTLVSLRTLMAGTSFEMPSEIILGLDIGRVRIGGIEVKGLTAKVHEDANGLRLERVALADIGGASLEIQGRIDSWLQAPYGTLKLDLNATSLDGVMAVLARYAPDVGDLLAPVVPRLMPAKLRAGVTVGRSGTSSRADIVVNGAAGAVRVNFTATATGLPKSLDTADISLVGKLDADEGAALLALFGADNMVGTEKGSAAITVNAAGRLSDDLRVDGRLTAAGLDATAKGTMRVLDGLAANVDLSVWARNVPFVRRLAIGSGDSGPVAMKARVALKNGNVALEDLSGTIAGTGVRGRLAIASGAPARLDGNLQIDSVDAATLVGAAAGAIPQRPGGAGVAAQPFARSAFADLSGTIEFRVARASFGGILARQLKGVLRLEESDIRFDDIEASVGNGRLTGMLSLRSGADALVAKATINLAGADLAALSGNPPRLPVSGRLSLQVEAEGSGVGIASLAGSLRGSGQATIESAQIGGLTAKPFDRVMRAVDDGMAIEIPKITEMVDASLAAGRLPIARLTAPFSIAVGQLRWANLTASSDGLDLTSSGSVDLAESLIDARLTLSSAGVEPGPDGRRPDISIGFRGPIAAPRRSIDVSALSSWLLLRAVERQARRIEALEAARREAEQAMEAAAAAARLAPPAAAPVPEQKPDAQVVPNSIPVEGQAPATTSSTNAATQAPVPPAAATPSGSRRATPARPSQIAPGSMAPLEIRPGQRTNRATQGQRAGDANAAERTPIRRWVLDPLFGAQR